MGVKPKSYDFAGWATRINIPCADGRVICRDAFKDMDGKEVPLVWNHDHSEPGSVLGKAYLEHRDEGVYCYGTFNSTENGKDAKKLVAEKNVTNLSIFANHLKETRGNVFHGIIREVSLVLAGANPGAVIETVLCHGDGEDYEESAKISMPDELSLIEELAHSDEDDKKKEEKPEVPEETGKNDEGGSKDMATENKEKTVKEVFDTLNEDQKTAVYAIIGQALEDAKGGKADDDENDDEGEEKEMKHNLFDAETPGVAVLSHADQEEIIKMAKTSSIGSFRDALGIYMSNDSTLAHSIDDIEQLFPEYHDTNVGEPNTITRDYTWVDRVIAGVHKSPYARVRTRWADARQTDFRAKGYKTKGAEKTKMGNIKLLKRTTDPQTIYVKDALNRDDILDITDFDAINYQYKLMRMAYNEELALAIMVGDGREEGDENKISEEHIRPIWKDDDLYTIHQDVDLATAKKELQGTNTSANFGENYIYAEAVIAASLTAREQYKGTGSLTFYCTPHMLNVMLLARDLNGRRIYTSKADLAAALDVKEIETVEQFEGLTRTAIDSTGASKTKKLLGIFANLNDYQVGAVKGGELTKFNQFDIDFNLEKFLMEGRCSGALTRAYSAIALEEDVTEDTQG